MITNFYPDILKSWKICPRKMVKTLKYTDSGVSVSISNEIYQPRQSSALFLAFLAACTDPHDLCTCQR